MQNYFNLIFFMFIITLFNIIFYKKNYLIILIFLEILLICSNLNFMLFAAYNYNIIGQIFILYTLVIAGTESAIGLILILIFFRLTHTLLASMQYT